MARPPWFSPGTQQDCSEFLKFLLDRVSEEDKSLNDSNDNDSQRTSLVDDTFAGKLLVCLCCRRCNNSSCREEVFTDLPLAFPQAGELEDRVDAMGNDDHTSTKQPVEHVDVTSAGSSTVSSERSLKGGDISHITSPSDLATKTAEENEAMATSTSHGPASGESSRSFSTNLPTKFHDSGVRVNAPNVSISELLEYFFEPEILQGSNQYHCEQCHSLQDAERTVTISKPSNFLVLTLKRFAYNVRTQQRSKILQSVTYPLTLKLPSVHLERSVPTRDAVFRDIQEGPPEVFEEKSEDLINESCFRSKRTKQEHDSVVNSASNEGVIDTCDEKPTSDIVYSLCSVIVHSGTSSESGHYYCYARSSAQVTEEEDVDDSASSRTTDQDTWFLFNDSRVSYSAFSTFADVSKRFPKDTPYVLIYKRVSPCGTIIPVESSREIRQDLADLVNRDNLLYLQVRSF